MTKSFITIGIDASRAFVDDPAGPEYYSWHVINSLTKLSSTHSASSGSQVQIRYILYLRPGQIPNIPLPQNFETKIINMRFLWTQVGLAIEAMRDRPDVMFIPAHTLPLALKVLLPQLPIVVTVHGLEGKYLPQSSSFLSHIYRNWSIGWAVRFATHLIAVSNDTRTDVLKTYHINSNRITMIHEGVDINQFKSKSKKPEKYYKTRKPYILFVGTLQPRKNLVRAIKAFSLLKNRSVRLIIAGKYGWVYEPILKAPRRYGVLQRVIFKGRVDDDVLRGLYKGASVFLMPSITEGFGLPILEAQAAGVPVVSSYGGALREVAGEGAIFINPKSVENIKSALNEVLESPKLRSELTAKGLNNVKKFSWEKTAYNTLKILLKEAQK